MKKRIISLVMVVIILAVTLSACSAATNTADFTSGSISNFKIIEENNFLVYDRDTKVVYYLFSTCTGYNGYGYLAPYISENGNFCKYVDDKIIEIQK